MSSHASTQPPFSFARRNIELDVLRGVAILAVIVNHCVPEVVPSLPEVNGAFGFVVWKLRALGWSGVDLFFVLSGFLIGGTLINETEKAKTISLSRFWAKRVFKILPSYFFLIITLMALGVVAVPWNQIPVHVFFLQNYLDPEAFGPTWSLAVEEHFYIFLPIALLALIQLSCRRGGAPLAYLPILSCCVFLAAWGLRIVDGITGVTVNDFMKSHFRADALFAGVFCHYLWRYHHLIVTKLVSSPLAWLALTLLLCPPLIWTRNDAMMFFVGFSSLTLGYSLLVLYSTCHGFGRLTEYRLVRGIAAMGRWSYNIYLWHYFIGALKIPGYVQTQEFIDAHVGDPRLSFVMQLLVFAITSVFLGYAVTQLIEEPFMRLRRVVLPGVARTKPATI